MRSLLRTIFLANLWLKVVSLALAGVLFLYVQGERRRDAFTDALVKLTVLAPRNKVLTFEPAEKLLVRLKGSRADIERLRLEGAEPLEIDLEGREPGPLRFTTAMFRLPSSVQVESISPPEIDVLWDTLAEKVVPLRARIAGQVAAGYRVAKITVDPQEVQLRGPKATLEKLGEVVLGETRVDGRTEDTEAVVPVAPKQKFVRVQPDSARVVVEVRAEVMTKRVPNIPVELLQRPRDLEVEVQPAVAREVLLEGTAPALARVEPNALRAVIELRELPESRPGIYPRVARVEGLPPGVRLLATTPPTFAVTLRSRSPDKRPEVP